MMKVQCAHEDEVKYPTAEVKIQIRKKELLVKIWVSSNLPREVLFVTNLFGFKVDRGQAHDESAEKQAEEEGP